MEKTTRWITAPLSAEPGVKSVGQVVAFNVTRARKERGMTQEDLAKRLRAITGRPWPRSAVTMTENAWTGEAGRLRTLDVDQVVAFAVALDMPISWFFMPPDDGIHLQAKSKPRQFTCDTKGAAGAALSGEQLTDIALSRLSSLDHDGLFQERVRKQAPSFDPVLNVERIVKVAQLEAK